jgi:hypothetical protein
MKIFLRNCHPVLVALYATLALIAVNISQMNLADGIRPLIAAILLALLILFICKGVIKNSNLASLAATWSILIIFFYGHIYEIFENSDGLRGILGHHRYLLPIWIGLWISGIWFILKKAGDGKNLNRILNAVSLALVALSLVQIGLYEFHAWQLKRMEPGKASSPTAVQNSNYKPDVYYIILDGYSRDDALAAAGFDNSAFLKELSSLGFYIAKCSQSNYGETPLSLSSSLNMDYIDQFAPSVIEEQENPVALAAYIRHSRVREEFNRLGYQFVSMESGVPWDEIVDADLYLLSQDPEGEGLTRFLKISGFEMIVLRTTLLRIIIESRSVFPEQIASVVETPEQTQYERVISVLDQLANLHSLPGPKFVFAHIVSPHTPYVFGAQGEFQVSETFKPGYINNVRYLNGRVLEIARSLIEKSSQPPVIILQADHGSTSEFKMAILNAYYLPSGGEADLYPHITPVNSFRIILNRYFDGSYPILPDISYYSVYKDVYNFQVVEYPCDVNR